MNDNINNPFASAGTAIQGRTFVGREYEKKNIEERLFNEEFGNVAIVGIPKIGKSSLMQEVLSSRSEDLWFTKKFIVVWYTFKQSVDNDRSEKRAVFVRLVSEVYHFLKRNGMNELLDELSEYYHVIIDTSSVWTEFEQNILYFFEEIVYAKIRVIYCIDEFDYSKDLLGESEYELLREISYRNSNKIAIVTASRRSIYDIEHYSGGGSNFYGTFENIYLKPFSSSEHAMQCNFIENIHSKDVDELFKIHGGHPYLNALVLKRVFIGDSISESNYKTNQDILRYYNDLFYVLSKDDLADKIDKLYCGYNDGVTETQEDYIYNCYGIFTEDTDGNMQPFSTTFANILNQRYRENPFSLTWPEAERAIRKSITYAMTEEYGDEDLRVWVDEIQDFDTVKRDRYNKWVAQMNAESRLYRARASKNIIDQLYPIDYAAFFKHFWTQYLSSIYGESLNTWLDRLNFIAKEIRNPEMHSRRNLISSENQQKATIICQEIIQCVKDARL